MTRQTDSPWEAVGIWSNSHVFIISLSHIYIIIGVSAYLLFFSSHLRKDALWVLWKDNTLSEANIDRNRYS